MKFKVWHPRLQFLPKRNPGSAWGVDLVDLQNWKHSRRLVVEVCQGNTNTLHLFNAIVSPHGSPNFLCYCWINLVVDDLHEKMQLRIPKLILWTNREVSAWDIYYRIDNLICYKTGSFNPFEVMKFNLKNYKNKLRFTWNPSLMWRVVFL